jgi:hypothetical protein
VPAAGWPHGHFNVLPETGEKFKQPPNRETARAIAHQEGDVRLFDAERRRCLALREAALPDDAADPEREAGFDQFLFRVGQAELGEDIGAAFGETCNSAIVLDEVDDMADDKPYWGLKVTTTPWPDLSRPTPQSPELGFVYLPKAGPHYKIGKTKDLDARLGQIKLQLPFDVEVVHKIATDDPTGIESYWHRRFMNKRDNGEWFSLSEEDVAAFTSRTKM